jgi:hypothetical protein
LTPLRGADTFWSVILPNARPRLVGLAVLFFGWLALAACSSSSGGTKTGAGGASGGGSGGGGTSGSGTGGGTAGQAGAPGDAAAGASGDASTAGAGGLADGGAAGATPDGNAPEVNACGFAPDLGTATFVMQSAQEGGDRSTSTVHDAIAWLGQLDDDTEPEMLDVQLYKGAAPFGAMLQSMSIPLTGQSDFKTCGACVFYHHQYDNGVELRAQKDYIATSGTLDITAVPNISAPGDGGVDAGGSADSGAGLQLTATLSSVTFEHVTIDDLFNTTVVTDGCTVSLTSASINASVPVSPLP